MHSIKDTVSEKLSSLFSASPSKSVDQQTQARPYTKEGKSVTSILSFLLPSTYSENIRYRDDVKPLQSHSFTWRSKSFSWRDKPLDDFEDHDDYKEIPDVYPEESENGCNRTSLCVKKGTVNTDRDNGEPNSASSIASGSETFEDAPDRHSFEQSMAYLTTDSVFITPDLYDFFQSSLPNIAKGCQWVLLYSTARHGISLRTLIRKSADLSGPCLLITGDKQGAVFGGLLEAPLRPTAKRKYQGTNQTFVFTTLYGEPRLFRPTGANRYFYLCLNDVLALGGGGNFALSLDGDLLFGSSGPCETFGNSFLAHDQEFELRNVELWGFTHASRYLTTSEA
ncbi:oxidation resistance protein 1 [Nicotiana tabacum]|uniref:Oxidation resistance protein 1 n=1 Tax=Nicotiana tabacum TaxID=4097 RepID=A0A1S3YE84_TOBAC|nr:PREDICTED: TLD domain-containing protein 2-like [Nicotiana tabacum]